MGFLEGFERRSIKIKDVRGFNTQGLILGKGTQPIEILLATSMHKPSVADVKAAWKARQGGRATPVLLVVHYGDKVVVCGPLVLCLRNRLTKSFDFFENRICCGSPNKGT